jgi:isocitrate dehydrogenase (NAD+)
MLYLPERGLMTERTIVVLEGDQTGQELLEEALRVLDPHVLRVPLNFARFDLSLEKRRETDNQIVRDAAAALREHGLGIKAATITPEKAGDAGSPNAILREEIDGKVILRVGRRLPGIRPVGGMYAPVAVVRMAVDDAYGAQEWREEADGEEVAYRTEKITRATTAGTFRVLPLQSYAMYDPEVMGRTGSMEITIH